MSADNSDALEYLALLFTRHRFQTDRFSSFADFGLIFQQEMENCAERINICSLVELIDLASGLFRRHVIARADNCAVDLY